MKANWSDFKLGLFVLAGLAILLAALFVFGASRLFEGKTVEETYIAGSAEGLKTGTVVTLHGVPVGEVSRINFSWNVYHAPEPRYVVVEFSVRNSVSLAKAGKGFAERVQEEVNKGLRARIKSQGLAGATILSLEYLNDPQNYPPLPHPWKPRHIYIPSAPGQFSEIMKSLNETMANLKSLNFQELGSTLQRDLTAGEHLLTHIDQANFVGLSTNANGLLTEFGRIGQNVDVLVDELRLLGKRLNAFTGEPGAGKTPNLQAISTDADELLNRLRATAGRLDSIAANVDTSSLNQTLENARRATADLEQVARQLKQYPSSVLFGKPP
ncbi:MAG TPA: MlaD family protein, partial [Verrucomicrobiae bacterium]|nr:MlaD family protein [Verrucomicrobiae bacterium]